MTKLEKFVKFLKRLAKKCGSRKFLLGLTGAITGLILASNGSAETAEKVSGIIMATASIAAYIFGEAAADAAHVGEEEEEKKEE